TDSIVASYVGYIQKKKPIDLNKPQVVNFQLIPDTKTLETVEIRVGDYENPAWEILRNVIKNKERNDKRSLEAYEYEAYTKIEIDIDNISDKFREKKVVKKITSVLDSIERIAGDDGKPILPMFISESISNFYYLKSPEREKEVIKKTKITGLGITDGSTVSQITGSSFQEYNFYKNWMEIVQKDFVSPISDSWRAFYDYELKSWEEVVDSITCYKIEFKPKNPEDLAFNGTMWIADSLNNFALKQIDVNIGKNANLNFIEKVKIQQKYEQVEKGGQWLPNKTRVIIDIGEIRNDWAGMLAKFYVSHKKFKINQPKPVSFFDQEFELSEFALEKNESFWIENRHDPLSETEQNVYHMIDTLKKIPVIKSYVEIANIVVNGYKKIGKFDIGPFIYTYANNNIEGNRFRLGGRTNIDFSKKFVLSGYGAYGLKDQAFKYNLEANYIPKRKPWTVVGIARKVDIDQVGIFNDNILNSSLFNSFSTFGTLRRPFSHTINKIWVNSEVYPGLTHQITFRNRTFNPLYPFRYIKSGEGTDQVLGENFIVNELIFEARIAIGEKHIINDNSRISLGNGNKPIFTLRYTYGLKDFWNSDFGYQRFDAFIDQSFRLGAFGRTSYHLAGGYVPSTIPYPLLETHLGNETVFLNENSFNMMDFFEFVSDQYASLSIMHRFDGLLLNRIPLISKLKWRTFGYAKVLYGSVRQNNIDIIPPTGELGNPIPSFQSLGNKPYTEVGYGIENIFRFVRVDFIHRLNYLSEDTKDFAVKISFQFRL
nr:carboxypeptidase-like regulatory domain-containing protein [Flammeovirgaceae bacterium]